MEKEKQIRPHPYMEHLESFNDKIVEVTTVLGDKIKGRCLGICKQHINIVLEVNEDIIVVKNVLTIRREK
jgi:small nuclear ribonucleoprotein (snRNP)-like protein